MARKVSRPRKPPKDIRKDCIKINDRFYFEKTSNCWNLYEFRSLNAPTPRDRYYNTLLDLCNAVIDISCDEANDMVSIKDVIEAAREDIIEALGMYTFTDEELLTAVNKRKKGKR